MKIHEFLNNDPTKWTKGAGSRDHRGNKVHESGILATCWCLTALINKVYGNTPKYYAVRERVREYLRRVWGWDCFWLHLWNDRPDVTFWHVRDLCLTLDI